MLSFEMARMWASGEQVPQRQSWVGELRSQGATITVTLMLYGEAALTVACRHLLSELDWCGRPPGRSRRGRSYRSPS